MIKDLAVTLIETLLTLLLLTLTLVMAIPSYQWLIKENQKVTAINQLVSALNYARVQAIKQRKIVGVCSTKDANQCSGQWQDGMMIFTEDKKLRVFAGLPLGSKLIWNRQNNLIQMAPTGYLKSQNGTFYFCLHEGENAKIPTVILSSTGRVRVSYTHDNRCGDIK